jgi:hypothetical protein
MQATRGTFEMRNAYRPAGGRNNRSLNSRIRHFRASVVRALTLPTWWEFI